MMEEQTFEVITQIIETLTKREVQVNGRIKADEEENGPAEVSTSAPPELPLN